MSELTVQCVVAGSATTVVVVGRVGAGQCRMLREALEMAARMRRHGPIIVDLTQVRYLCAAAVLILRRAADHAHLDRRVLSVRNIDVDAIVDKRAGAGPVRAGPVDAGTGRTRPQRAMRKPAAAHRREVTGAGAG